MIINHNVMALNAYRQLNATNSAGSKALEKLSSGLRINRAGDDAAGLAISEKMRGQIRGLDMASRNAQDGISLIQTAEGALNETHSILQRMRELASQAANDTNTTIDRGEIQKEIDQLVSEIDRIGDTTEFNTKKLLNGGAGLQVEFTSKTVNGVSQDWIQVTGGTAETAKSGTVNITAASKAAAASTTITVAAAAGDHTFSVNGYTLSYTAVATAASNAALIADLINANSDKIGATASATGADLTITNTTVGSAAHLTVSADPNAIVATTLSVNEAGTDASVTGISGDVIARGNTITVVSGSFKGMELQLNSAVMSDTASENAAVFEITGNGVMAMQIGANEGQTMSVSINDMRSTALGISAINVSNNQLAGSAITTIQKAIETVSAERSKLGAYQNRLEHTINNLGTSAENITAAESRIRDVDMAKEMMEFTRTNILAQAGTAMLAQANAKPQSVLQLLQ
jgi:flagellin